MALSDTPTIMRIMPACPKCGSLSVKTRSSRAYDYGARKAYANCGDPRCGAKFAIVWERPREPEESF